MKQWSVNNKELYHDYGEYHLNWIQSMIISPDFSLLFTAGGSKKINILNVKERKLCFEMSNAHKDHIRVLAIHWSSNVLYSGGADGHLKQWRIYLSLIHI